MYSAKKIKSLREKIIKGTLECEFTDEEKQNIEEYVKTITSAPMKISLNELEDIIMVCLDYYTYSINGDMLIPDSDYTFLQELYKSRSGKGRLIYADTINTTKWEFKKHSFPGMVGSLGKIYEMEDLIKYVNSWVVHGKTRQWEVSPKYDGISACLEIRNHELVSALTRYNGYEGQDITSLVKNASNIKFFTTEGFYMDGFYKVEIVTEQKLFEELITEKKYANRRSATSGIINTPKNTNLAKYLTIIPLVYSNGSSINYIAPDAEIIETNEPSIIYEKILELLQKIRHADYPVRTDGVVITPLGDDVMFNPDDVMDTSIAFKVNMEEAYTTIDYGYVSVGNAGYAVPMLHVKPVEVNETIVEDVSLDTFDKFAGMGLYENETVMVFSAGNVIPKAKLPLHREYPKNANILEIPRVCPYCNTKLTRKGGLYKCENNECVRVLSGKISNFVIKLGAKNVAENTITTLFENGLLTDIPSLFNLSRNDISKIEGFAETSADNIVSEIERLRDTPTEISVFLGALGIDKISVKKCRNIMKHLSIDDIINKKPKKLWLDIVGAENTGDKTANVFIEFIKNNRDMIRDLYEIMNIVEDQAKKYRFNVVFTGFRNPVLKDKFEKMNIEVSDSINGDTKLVIAASYNPLDTNHSGKIKNALKKGIHIISLSEVDKVIDELKLSN